MPKSASHGLEDQIWSAIKNADKAKFQALLRSTKLTGGVLTGPWNQMATIDFSHRSTPVTLTQIDSFIADFPQAFDKNVRPYATDAQAKVALDNLSNVGGFPQINFYAGGRIVNHGNVGALANGGNGTNWHLAGTNLVRQDWTETINHPGYEVDDGYDIVPNPYNNMMPMQVPKSHWEPGSVENIKHNNTAYVARIGQYLFTAPTPNSAVWQVLACNVLTADYKYVDTAKLHRLRIEAFRQLSSGPTRQELESLTNSLSIAYLSLDLPPSVAEQKQKTKPWEAYVFPDRYPYLLLNNKKVGELQIISAYSQAVLGHIRATGLPDGSRIWLPVVNAPSFRLQGIRVIKQEGHIRLAFGNRPFTKMTDFPRLRPGQTQAISTDTHTANLKAIQQTDVNVEVGDRVEITADGSVGLGPMAGSGDPEGINYGTSYNLYTNVNHGALCGKIGDKPFYIGRGVLFTSPWSGPLILRVNDNDSGNNGGGFNVKFTITKPQK